MENLTIFGFPVVEVDSTDKYPDKYRSVSRGFSQAWTPTSSGVSVRRDAIEGYTIEAHLGGCRLDIKTDEETLRYFAKSILSLCDDPRIMSESEGG